MFVEVRAPRAAAPTTGLLQSAPTRPDAGVRWENGIAWRSERCISHQGFAPCGDVDGVPSDVDNGPHYHLPNGFRVWDFCTLLNGELDSERVRRQADAVASYVMAQELWNGTLGRNNPGTLGDSSTFVNDYLTNPATLTDISAAGTLIERFGVLEEETLRLSRGQQVMLHVPPRLIAPLSDVLRRQGNLLYTALDSVVVADAGYPGTGPFDAGTAEVETVTITGEPTGGTFTLTYSGQTTAAVPFDATAAALQAALEALSNVQPGDLTVTGGAGGPWTVTFSAELGDVPEMTGDGAGLTGGTAPAVAVATVTPGVAPSNAAGTWAYGTPVVETYLSPTVITDSPVETIDRRRNRQEVWGERLFASIFDPCVHTAAELVAAA